MSAPFGEFHSSGDFLLIVDEVFASPCSQLAVSLEDRVAVPNDVNNGPRREPSLHQKSRERADRILVGLALASIDRQRG